MVNSWRMIDWALCTWELASMLVTWYDWSMLIEICIGLEVWHQTTNLGTGCLAIGCLAILWSLITLLYQFYMSWLDACLTACLDHTFGPVFDDSTQRGESFACFDLKHWCFWNCSYLPPLDCVGYAQPVLIQEWQRPLNWVTVTWNYYLKAMIPTQFDTMTVTLKPVFTVLTESTCWKACHFWFT